jgi:hypothetical protein
LQIQLTPRPLGNLYDAAASFGATCAVANGAMTGHAFQSFLTGVVYVLLRSSAGDGAMLLLSRQ